jgi:hypothetical protein
MKIGFSAAMMGTFKRLLKPVCQRAVRGLLFFVENPLNPEI